MRSMTGPEVLAIGHESVHADKTRSVACAEWEALCGLWSMLQRPPNCRDGTS